MMDPDLSDLLSAWLGGEVDPARREDLVARLRRDEAFRRAFVDELWMLGKLKAVQTPEPRWLRLEDELGWGASEPSDADAIEDRVARRIDALPRPRRPSRWAWRALVAAAALLAVGLTLWLRPWGRPEVRVAARPYPKVDTVDGLGIVVKLDGVRWEPTGEPHPTEGDVVPAGRLRLRSGRLTFSMLTGVLLVAEGPADLDLVSDNKIVCNQGKLRVRVPSGAEGFVVSGPGSAVIDWGTEFGLNVEPDGTSHARVFQGRVEAAVTGADGIPRRTQLLRESESSTIDPKAGQIELGRDAGDFLGPSDLIAPPLPLDAGYPAAVLRSKPWGYWRFGSMAGGAVPDEVPGRPPLRVNGPIRLAGPPDGNRVADFRAVEGPQSLELEGTWRPSWRPGFAVELWCLSDQISHATLAAMAAPHDTNNHMFLLEFTSRNGLHKPGAVRLLHRWPPGGSGGDNLYSRGPYVPYRWKHLVGQVLGDRIELFVDGEPVEPLSIGADHADVDCVFLLGRLTRRPGRGISIDRAFVGRLDEVALYDHPLTVEEIRAHHRLGSGRAGTR